MLVGHSQGGIIAGQLASDPAFVRDYGVTNVLTYGAPIDHMQLAPGVQALQVQHRFDVVPRLDLGGVDLDGRQPQHPRHRRSTLDSPGGIFGVVTNHAHTEYTQLGARSHGRRHRGRSYPAGLPVHAGALPRHADGQRDRDRRAGDPPALT